MSKRWPHKVIVGLTGNIATGKSAVMRLAHDKGALTLDADKIVHEILEGDPGTQAAIIAAFGSEVGRPDGRIDRDALGAIVFRDATALSKLEQIVHPAVRQELIGRIDESSAAIIFIEAIKLLEGGLAADCDQIWVTRCPVATQIERLKVCRGMDEASATLRIDAQSSQEDKVLAADVVIDTDGTMADTQTFFELAWAQVAQALPDETEIQEATSAESARRSPPERLNRAAAAELKKKLKIKRPLQAEPESAAVATDLSGPDGVAVRRARPSDVPAILLLIQKATDGRLQMKRAEMLNALSERGYLIGQQGTEISAIAGWNSENLVATIDQFFVCPLEAAPVTGAALLQEIEKTANQLICEVILAVLSGDRPDEITRLFSDGGFLKVDPEALPRAWRAALTESQLVNNDLMMKRLRDTRQLQIPESRQAEFPGERGN